MKCRHCQTQLNLQFLDLGTAPHSNAYLPETQLNGPESWFPLKVLTCTNCWLVQTLDFAKADELFNKDYAYFSGFSSSWLSHCRAYVNQVTARFNLSTDSHVVEVASNDGHLLQYFRDLGIPCTGVEPTNSTAKVARDRGISVIEEFFGAECASTMAARGLKADLMVANNVLAHVPDINDFVQGFQILLKPQGVATFEFPHLQKLLEFGQFDTIYHEHFSYLSLCAVKSIVEKADLQIFDVEELSTHGGSLRVYVQSTLSGDKTISKAVDEVVTGEVKAGLLSEVVYSNFQDKAEKIKNDFLSFLISAREQGKKVLGYGAAAKGNTILNFGGIKQDLLSAVVDKNPAKIGKYLPGSRIPIIDEAMIKIQKPDYIVILPWNLKEEIQSQLSYIEEWGGRFVSAVPQLSIQ